MPRHGLGKRYRHKTPVARPLLPALERILPFLQRIDALRVYSNNGPLVQEFEEKLAEHFGLPAGQVVTMASGTAGLVAALLAASPSEAGPPAGSLCLMPAWTFVASAHAARLAGLEPYFLDVDETGWMITPDGVRAALPALTAPVGAVMVGAPFGQAVDIAAWDRFTADTGIPVVIDAAAGFDTLKPGRSAAVVSLHATKVLGMGEGGLVATSDPDLASDIRRRANFGFRGERIARVAALNAKMSEYAAAVGLAALADWPATRADFVRVAHAYSEAFAVSRHVRVQPGYGEWATSTCVVRLARPVVDPVARKLDQRGIDTRAWWGDGLHHNPAFAGCGRTPLEVTGWLARHTLGLPCYRDLPDDRIGLIASIVLSVCRHGEEAEERAAGGLRS